MERGGGDGSDGEEEGGDGRDILLTDQAIAGKWREEEEEEEEESEEEGEGGRRGRRGRGGGCNGREDSVIDESELEVYTDTCAMPLRLYVQPFYGLGSLSPPASSTASSWWRECLLALGLTRHRMSMRHVSREEINALPLQLV